MFSVEDYVIYGATGVCKIAEMKKERMKGVTKEYYVLKPVFSQNSAVYVPVDSPALVEKIQPVISVTELDKVLSGISNRSDEWIQNDSERTEKYKEILRSGNRAEIIEIIRVIHRRQKELITRGKHLHVADERQRFVKHFVDWKVKEIRYIPIATHGCEEFRLFSFEVK